jgi:hypothetical protein
MLHASLNLCSARIYLQFFRVLFNSSFPWVIQKDLWIFKAVQWLLFRLLVMPKGYATYITVFYVLSGLVLSSLVVTAWVAVLLKGSETNNVWLNRLIKGQQLFAMVIYTLFWPAILDYFAFMADCRWTNMAAGGTPTHIYFEQHSEWPRLAAMLLQQQCSACSRYA